MNRRSLLKGVLALPVVGKLFRDQTPKPEVPESPERNCWFWDLEGVSTTYSYDLAGRDCEIGDLLALSPDGMSVEPIQFGKENNFMNSLVGVATNSAKRGESVRAVIQGIAILPRG